MNLPVITIVYGSLLIVLGVAGYFMSGMVSITALIPAFLGIIILVSGVLAQKESRRKLFMHIALVFGLLGFLGTASALPSLITMIGGEEVTRPGAVIGKSVTAILSLIFLIIGVKSFIDARRNPAA
ncbi:MAG: hypothetical protein IH931_07190 [candidate division Zixibacteria bacterium]|nr:hypothetical protein [candidate division Zixibacteria bacterium]